MAERLEIELKRSGSYIRKTGELVFTLRGVDEVVGVPVIVDVHACLESMLSEHLREVIREFVAMVGGRKLEAVAAKDESRVGVLNHNRGSEGRSVRQIKVEVAAIVEAQLVHRLIIEDGVKRELEEVARGTVGQRQSIAGGGGRGEVAVRTAVSLIVVGAIQRVFAVQDCVDLAEGGVLIEAARKRS